MTKSTDRIISKHMSKIAKRGHEKSPRSKEHFRRMQAKSVAARLAKKLSTGKDLRAVSKGV